MGRKTNLLTLLLIFGIVSSVYATENSIITTSSNYRIFNGDEFNSFDVEGDYVVFIGGNQYKDTFPGLFGGDYYGVWIYNINTKELELITNPHDESTERLVSLDNNKVYWMETRVHNTEIFSYDLIIKEEEVTNLNVVEYIESYDNSNKKSWDSINVESKCENDDCYNEELYIV